MRYWTFLMAVGVAANCWFSSFASTAWFDAGVSRYSSWPSDGSDFTVEHAGVWSGTSSATLEGEASARYLKTTGEGKLGFSVSPSVPASASERAFVMTIRFAAADEIEPPDPALKGGLTVLTDPTSGSAGYCGVAQDAAGGTNVWLRLSGAVPVLDADVEVAMAVREVGGRHYIRYSVGGSALRAGSTEWLPVTWSDNDGVSRVDYIGEGIVRSLAGSYESDEGGTCALRLPALTGMTVSSVTADGVSVAPDAGGAYVVSRGSTVTLTFAPLPRYLLETTTVVVTVWEDLTLEDLPEPERLPEVSDSLRFLEICGVPDADAAGDTGEYIVLTNLSGRASLDLEGVGVYIGKASDVTPSTLDKAKCAFTIPAGVTIPAGGALRFDQADWWPGDKAKITNGELALFIFDADGALAQSSSVDQNAFPSVNLAGASLIATAFGPATTGSNWRPSFSDAYAFVRFAAFDGIPAGDFAGTVGEWVAFTNLCPDVALDLSGMRFIIGKKKDLNKDINSSACDFKLGEGVTIPAGGELRLTAADVAGGWTKITNGDLLFYLYDADGQLVQNGEIAQSAFERYYGGGGDTGPGGDSHLYATAFGRELETADWADSGVGSEEDGPEDDPADFDLGATVVTNATDATLVDAIRVDLSKVGRAGRVFMAWADGNRGGDITNWTGCVSLGDVSAGQTELLVKAPDGYNMAARDYRCVKFFFTEGTATDGLEYVRSDGSQEVNLDYKPKANTVVRMKFLYEKFQGKHFIGTARDNPPDTNDWRFQANGGTTYYDLPGDHRVTATVLTSNTMVYEFELGNYYVKDIPTGEVLLSGGDPVAFENYDYPLWLFDPLAYGRVYYLQIFEGETLVCDLVPVRDGNDVPCLYDRERRRYFYPQTGTLEAGPDKTEGLDIADMTFGALSPAVRLDGADWATASGSRQLGDVRITEFQAKNGATLTSAEGEASDWVELTNYSDHDVNLCGWGLSDSKGSPLLQRIPAGVSIPAGGRLVVLCDEYNCVCAAGEVHVALGLSTAAGEYLSLASPDGTVVTSVKYPAQIKDISYGVGHRARTILGEGAPAFYRVGGEGEWKPVIGAAGMSSEAGSFTARAWQLANGDTANLETAESRVAGKAPTKVTTGIQTIAFQENDNVGNLHFPPYAGFSDLGVSGDYYAVEFSGSIVIPRANQWTFCVNSDDGFRLEVSRGDMTWSMVYENGRGYGQSMTAFSFPEPGVYALRLFYFEQTGGASLDLSVAEGDYTVADSGGFSVGRFGLVGSGDVVHTGALAAYLGADVASEMKGKTTKLGWKSSFALDSAPAEGDSYALRVRYADGLVAKVNGNTIATVGTAKRSAGEALVWSEFAIPGDCLVVGENTVELEVTNDAIGDEEAIAGATVVVSSGAGEWLYFRSPTPGAANESVGYGEMTPKVEFSVEHGYKTEPIELVLSCKDASSGAIYYTLDGTSPTKGNGIRYTAGQKIYIDRTTCVRAAVPDEESVLQYDTSATYLFLDDILTQDANPPAGFPAANAVNNHNMRYGMNQNVVNGSDRARLIRGFTNGIDTISLVIDPKNLFSASSGIYVNPSGSGRDWERQTMVEGICPTNSANDFTIPGGIRIRGAASRTSGYAKHSLRLFFRSEYGEGSLDTKLFGDEGADSFDKVDLRTSQNYSWSNENSSQDTFIHEVFSRDSQRDMGQPYTRSRYYHLYINGQYWGLYQTEERADEDFAESYLGGDADDYDVIKTNSSGGRELEASAGTIDNYNALRDLAREGFGGEHANNYLKAMGLNPDGTRNDDYPVLLDPENLAVYMLCAHYVVDGDSPTSVWGGMANNIFAMRNRFDDWTGEDHRNGFVFLRHDAEHSMGTYSTGSYRQEYCRYDMDPTSYGTSERNDAFASNHFNPAQLNFRLCENSEYRMLLADLFYRHFLKAGGAMTAEKAWARFKSRMDEIDDAIVGEAARWGRGQTRQTWINACNECKTFIDNRLGYMKQQYKNRGWYPSIDAPTATLSDLGDAVTVAAANGETLYYTADGSDPRLAGGGRNPAAKEYDGEIEVGRAGITLKVRALKDGEWSALEELTVEGREPKLGDALRLHSFDGATPTADGDSDEWIVLTNILSDASFNLTGVKVVFVKAGDKLKDAKCIVSLAAGTLPAGGSVRLEQSVYGWSKITNNKIQMYVYDTDGATVIQSSAVTQKDFADYYGDIGDGGPGGRCYLQTTNFADATGNGDWVSVPYPAAAVPTLEDGTEVGTVEGAVATIDAAKAGAGSVILVPGAITGVRMSVSDGASVIDTTAYYTSASLVPSDGRIVPALDAALVSPVFADSVAGAGDAIRVDAARVLLTVAARPGLFYTLWRAGAVDGDYQPVEGQKTQAKSGETKVSFLPEKGDAPSAFFKVKASDR